MARALRILFLGGTGFIGPHMVRRALERGHDVTLFNRGRSNTDLFLGVAKLTGDRDGDLESLRGHRWDVVIDNSATEPKWVRDSAALLKDAVDCYVFTSTRSVYSDFSQIGMDETGPVYEVDRVWVGTERRLAYGQQKALCELETKAAMGERYLIVRPGLIVGPGDATDRFTYWPVRIDRGGEVFSPGGGSDGCMFIDVRDLAEWYILLVEQGSRGTFNALGPRSFLSFAELLYGIRAVTTRPTTFTWVDADFLSENRVRAYSDMPLWTHGVGRNAGFARFDISKSLAAGLTYRPLAVTARDTLEWHYQRPAEEREPLRSGISPEREAELLALWHNRGR